MKKSEMVSKIFNELGDWDIDDRIQKRDMILQILWIVQKEGMLPPDIKDPLEEIRKWEAE